MDFDFDNDGQLDVGEALFASAMAEGMFSVAEKLDSIGNKKKQIKRYYRPMRIIVSKPERQRTKGLFRKKTNAIEIGFSSGEARKMSRDQVVTMLQQRGFVDIEIHFDESLEKKEAYKDGQVESVVIDGTKSMFRKGAKICFDTPIVVNCYGRKCISLSSIPQNYAQMSPSYIIDKINELGFDEVEINTVYDVSNKFFSVKGPYIKYFWVDDQENFDFDMYYPANTPIFIEFHDYERKEKKIFKRK